MIRKHIKPIDTDLLIILSDIYDNMILGNRVEAMNKLGNIILKDITQSEPKEYMCAHCGRVFKSKVNHICKGMYRKRKHNWIPLY